MGPDQTVFCLADNEGWSEHVVHGFWEFSGLKNPQRVQRTRDLYVSEHPMFVSVDAVGIGSGTADDLEAIGVPVFRVMGGAAAFNPDYYDLRSELFWIMRRKFERHIMHIVAQGVTKAQRERIIREVSSLRYYTTSKGKIRFESKEEYIKRVGKSPDYADTLSYTMVTMEMWEGAMGDQGDIEVLAGDPGPYPRSTWGGGGIGNRDNIPDDPDRGAFGEVSIVRFGVRDDYDDEDDG